MNEFATWTYPNGEKVKIIKWPPNSSDLNPIKMMWAIMKERMSKYK